MHGRKGDVGVIFEGMMVMPQEHTAFPARYRRSVECTSSTAVNRFGTGSDCMRMEMLPWSAAADVPSNVNVRCRFVRSNFLRIMRLEPS